MFTGIVEETGRIRSLENRGDFMRVTVAASEVPKDLRAGSSVAVNGVCLTVVGLNGGEFGLDVVRETLNCTNLGSLAEGALVNLERPLAANGRFEGHIVQGHVDGIAELLQVTPEGGGQRMRFALPEALRRYVVHKGSITVDGVSLTVAAAGHDWFEVAVIPHTLKVTVLGERRVGDRVNLEVDILAKYLERMSEEAK